MKIRAFVCVALVAGLIGWAAGSAFTEDKPADPMAAMAKQGAPGDHHALLMKYAGEFEVTGKMWPNGVETPVKATSTNTALLGGRWLRHEYSTPEFFGKPFHGIGYIGFDNIQGKFVSYWIDDFSTNIQHKSGTCSDDGKTITTTGKWEGGVMGVFDSKMIWEFKDENTFTITSYASKPDVPEWKEMQITYTRKGTAGGTE